MMNRLRWIAVSVAVVLLTGQLCFADIKTVVDHNDNEHATAEFKFEKVPSPSKTDAATSAKFTIVDGERDENGGDLDKLNDGQLPTEADQPSENFFLNAGTEGGRLLLDLGKIIEIKQINTYSWHPTTRGPQVYKVYGSDGKATDFNAKPRKGTDPEKVGWKHIASLDTRPKEGEGGGQYGVSISDSNGSVGKFRYLLFDISRTEDTDEFGNTFYSEIDVVDHNPAASSRGGGQEPRKVVHSPDGKYSITIDTTDAPDLTAWANSKLADVAVEWYPKLVEMLPSEGYSAPSSFSITFRQPTRGNFVAYTAGRQIVANAEWIKHNLRGEAVGALVHEMVHVVQQYGGARRNNPNATRPPGWLVEGIPDYIRWYLYEPQSHGADIRNPDRAKYDGSYRVTANFLNWVTQTQDKDIVRQLNAAMRQGKYNEELWKQYTGKTPEELGQEWKQSLRKK